MVIDYLFCGGGVSVEDLNVLNIYTYMQNKHKKVLNYMEYCAIGGKAAE